jgi:uncharacterized RDD family membrane protein YckC
VAEQVAASRYVARETSLRRRLLTPEGLDLGVVLADAGQRASAFMIDAVFIILALIALTLFVIFGLFGVVGVSRSTNGLSALAIIWLIGWFVLRNGYFIGFELRGRAATPGKRISGLRVIARDGGRLTADAVIARNLMREIEVFLPLSFLSARAAEGSADRWLNLLGFAWAAVFLFFPLFNKDRLRVGDLLAGTWVIRARPQTLAADLGATSDGAPPAYRFTDAQLDIYGEFELQTLERVLRENHQEALDTVTAAIVQRIGWAEPVADPRGFLAAFYRAQRPQLERRMLFGRRKADKTVR